MRSIISAHLELQSADVVKQHLQYITSGPLTKGIDDTPVLLWNSSNIM